MTMKKKWLCVSIQLVFLSQWSEAAVMANVNKQSVMSNEKYQ
jgi:hypothetical protein